MISSEPVPSTSSVIVAAGTPLNHITALAVKGPSSMTFREVVQLVSLWRDYMHDNLYPHDRRPIISRTAGELQHWLRAREAVPNSLGVTLPAIDPVLNSVNLILAFSALNVIKPFSANEVSDRSLLHDQRPWKLFQMYHYSASALSVDILRSRRTPNVVDDPDLSCGSPGTAFERLLYLVYLGKLLYPDGLARPVPTPRYEHHSFVPSHDHFSRVAHAIQAIVRAWSVVARVFGFDSIDALMSPYVVFNNKTRLFRPLLRSEGFALRTQSNFFDQNHTPTTDHRQTYPGVTERPPQLDHFLRFIVKVFIGDLSKHILSNSLFETSLSSWTGHSFVLPSETTVFPRRFDELLPILAQLQRVSGRGVFHPIRLRPSLESCSPDTNNIRQNGSPQSSPTTPTPHQRASLGRHRDDPDIGNMLSKEHGKRLQFQNTENLNLVAPFPISKVTPPDPDLSRNPDASLNNNPDPGPVPQATAPVDLPAKQEMVEDAKPIGGHHTTRGLKRLRKDLSHIQECTQGSQGSLEKLSYDSATPVFGKRKNDDDMLPANEPNTDVLDAKRVSPLSADKEEGHVDDAQKSGDEIQVDFSTSIFSEQKDESARRIRRTMRKIRLVERSSSTNVPYVSLPPLSIPPLCVMKFLSSLWHWPTFSSEYAHRATHLWPTDVIQKFVANDMDVILATESVACSVYVAPSKVSEGSLGVFAGKAFATGDVVCNYYGVLAYEFEKCDGSGVGVSVGSDEMSLLLSSVENFGIGLPRIVSDMTIKNGVLVKRAYVVPFAGCVASRIVHAFNVKQRAGIDFPKVMNARCERKRKGCGIRRLYELCETNAITVVASRCITVDEEICMALNRFQGVPSAKKPKETSPAEQVSDSESSSTSRTVDDVCHRDNASTVDKD